MMTKLILNHGRRELTAPKTGSSLARSSVAPSAKNNSASCALHRFGAPQRSAKTFHRHFSQSSFNRFTSTESATASFTMSRGTM